MFRGKESLNRIELSRLVLELLNFGVSGSLRLWGWGVVGVPPSHVHMHTHTCTHMHVCKYDNFMQMATPIGLGEIPGIPYDAIHACAYVCVCTCTCMHVCACACV